MSDKRVAFILASTDIGAIIVNRLDCNPEKGFGVGAQLLETSGYEDGEFHFVAVLLDLRRRYRNDGVVALDCGANIGAHTIRWARHMRGWGEVISFEAQERVFYALAGNIALSNCFNARAVHAVVSNEGGWKYIPQLDHRIPGSFGSLEVVKSYRDPDVGQEIDYVNNLARTPMVTLDELGLARVDLLKIDVEGMEPEVLQGARGTIRRNRPVIIAEWIKCNAATLHEVLLDWDYNQYQVGMNILAVPKEDSIVEHIEVMDDKIALKP